MSAIVVSDSSPLHYLVLCEAIEVLPRLFERVIVPEIVVAELSHPNTPAAVRGWLTKPAVWVDVRKPTATSIGVKLGRGETEVIALAVELKLQAVLIDDHKAGLVARQKGLAVIGTLALLERSAELHFIDFRTALAALRQTNFRIHPRLLNEALARHEQRKRGNSGGR